MSQHTEPSLAALGDGLENTVLSSTKTDDQTCKAQEYGEEGPEDEESQDDEEQAQDDGGDDGDVQDNEESGKDESVSREENQRYEYATVYSPLPTSRSIRLIDLNADELNWTLNTFLPPFKDYLIRRGRSTGTNPDFGATEIISNDLPRELELQDDLDCDILANLMDAALFYYGVRWFSRVWIKQD
ncbi:uncharacterized protein PAC_10877 [Phialocephala subalpina]|uniref:Uncharacterized protein n=1 Tax=Phialocephala subalpina TaxID=576137 RepID=A0A1L7X7I5_9HELO|nr:uncharacterized protein PAC_10877 [Phialocephala subalpina]